MIKFSRTRTFVACLLTLAASNALPQSGFDPIQRIDTSRFSKAISFIKVAHENVVVDPTVRRFTGMVVDLGSPDQKGRLLSFKTKPLGPRSFPLTHDDLKGWRLTVLAGKRFGDVFTVSTNTESEITVRDDKGPIDGLDVRDVFIVESVDANGVSMFGDTGNAASPDKGT
jgi:hypothetical protein